MNKLTIPALLLGVVMVAGAFAFMPVQEASTVHTTGITQGTTSTTTTVAFATAGDLVFTCGADAGCVIQEIYLNSDGTTASVLTTVKVSTATSGIIQLASGVADIVANAATTVAIVAGTGGTVDPIVIPAGKSMAIAAADGVNGNVEVTTISSGVLTVSAADLA